ncbi:MAG TPA: hypothetical protein PLN21_02805 [Gemmatales bacterium]|nr:hypothetical protein [Gemmatales bacterium]
MRTFAMIAIIALGLMVPGTASAQTGDSEFLPDYARAVLSGETAKSDIQQVECSSCGGMRPYTQRNSGCATCGGVGGTVCSDGCQSGLCKPGRTCKWTGSCGNGFLDSFCGGLAECLCCSDPCYEPCWSYAANAALWQDTVRPQTYTTFRYDSFRNLSAPRIVEYYMPRKSVNASVKTLDMNELTMYQEVASDRASIFTSMPYRTIEFPNPDATMSTAHPTVHNAGFGDLTIGTKSLLLDCELLQFTFQFKTFIPTAPAASGIGTGHVSLEPAFLLSLKLFDHTYLQSEVAYWIPIGGDSLWNGPVTSYHLSINQVLMDKGPWQVIGTAEINGWTFSHGFVDGSPDDNDALLQSGTSASSKTYANVGPGLRIVYCDHIDVGFGYAHAITDQYMGQNWYRGELRIKY